MPDPEPPRRPGRRRYVFDGERLIETEPAERTRYGERVRAEQEEERCARERALRDTHPGSYA